MVSKLDSYDFEYILMNSMTFKELLMKEIKNKKLLIDKYSLME